MKAARYRIGQGLSALLAIAVSPDLELAAAILSECEYSAFCAMSRAEQVHSLKVLDKVMEADADAPSALRAGALLHDVGKSRYRLAIWQKTLAVLVTALAPTLSRKLSEEDESLSWWRAPFVVGRQHAKWGGEILRACGSDGTVIWLVEHHQEDAGKLVDHQLWHLLQALQRADNMR